LNATETVKGTWQKSWGYLLGLSMAGITAITPSVSSVGTTVQRACSGGCPSCYACSVFVVPLLAVVAVKHESKRKRLTSALILGFAALIVVTYLIRF
jgi:hypothetical protein